MGTDRLTGVTTGDQGTQLLYDKLWLGAINAGCVPCTLKVETGSTGSLGLLVFVMQSLTIITYSV